MFVHSQFMKWWNSVCCLSLLLITPFVKYRKITYPRIINHGNGKPTLSSVDFPIHNSIKKSTDFPANVGWSYSRKFLIKSHDIPMKFPDDQVPNFQKIAKLRWLKVPPQLPSSGKVEMTKICLTFAGGSSARIVGTALGRRFLNQLIICLKKNRNLNG